MNDETSLNKSNTSSFNEGGHSCALKGASFFTIGVNGALPLLQAGPGCSYSTYFGVINHCGESYPFGNTGMCSNEVIFGGEKKLKKGIMAIQEIHNPELVVVIPGCQALTIGDDIQAVVSELNTMDSIKPEIAFSNFGGYQGNLFDGFIKTGLTLLAKYCQKKPVKKRTVNIIGFPAHINIYWKGDLEEIRRLIFLLGLEIHCFYPGDVSLEQIRAIPSAELNLIVDEHTGLEMAQYLEKEYGTPYIVPAYGTLVGSDTTFEFLNEIIKVLDLDSNLINIIEKERRNALEMACQGHHVWFELIQHATNFAIAAHGSMALGLTRLLMCELGIEPKVINLTPATPGSKEKLIQLLIEDKREFAPVILENCDNHQMMLEFKDDWPTFIFGKGTNLKSDAFMNKTKVFLTIAYPAYDRKIIYNRPIMGFRGIPALLDDIMTRLFYFF